MQRGTLNQSILLKFNPGRSCFNSRFAMKSSHFVLFCFALYLCYDSVTSKRHFSQEDGNFLDDGGSWRTEKLGLARKFQENDLDPVYILQREDEPGKNIFVH